MNTQELIGAYERTSNFCKTVPINKVIQELKQLDEPQKPVVKQFVADWYEEHKDDFEGNLFRLINRIPAMYQDGEFSEFEEWIIDSKTEPFQTLVNMHQFGYEVEKEKRYIVKIKGIAEAYNCLNYNTVQKMYSISTTTELGGVYIIKFTRKQLEEAGFGWVFDCEGVEVEEVEG